MVITEKLDGGNTLLHSGEVFARSTSAPSAGKWMAMVKKHHAWKVREPDVYLYGEEIYGVHTIVYGAVPESETFYAFALRYEDGAFAPFEKVESYAEQKEIPVAPVLFKGRFESLDELRGFVEHAHSKPSALGGAREGVVLRLAKGFPAKDFPNNVCKSVRVDHVQTDEHWTRNWRPCEILR
ncbi:MAG: RNA ligase family protein [Gammaproteobacteria bacterium]|nr:RNA ligase family protein [Gammaproteobacteria bacterium]